MNKITKEQRRYLEELFKPFGIKYIILHTRSDNKNISDLRVRSDITGTIECEFGDVKKFLALQREQQLKRIRAKLSEC